MSTLRETFVFLSLVVFAFAILYVYIIPESSRVDNEPTDSQLLLVDSHASIRKFNFQNSTFDVLYDPSKYKLDVYIGAVSCSYELDAVYFTEHSSVYALERSIGVPRILYVGSEDWKPVSMSVEHVTGKLYVGDATHGGVTVHDLVTGDSASIFGAGLLLCLAVAVDAEEKYLFVLDKYMILRSDLDGQNEKRIIEVTEPVKWGGPLRRFRHARLRRNRHVEIDSMAIDQHQKRIYWACVESNSIKSSDYNGEDRSVFYVSLASVRDRSRISALIVMHHAVYWVNPTEPRRLIKIKSNEDYTTVYTGIGKYAHMSMCERRPESVSIPNPCGVENGGCQQLCLLSKSNSDGFVCQCKFGYELEKDQRSCRLTKEYLVFMESRMMKALSLGDTPSYVYDPPGTSATSTRWLDVNVMVRPEGLEEDSMIDFDTRAGLVYYTSKVNRHDEHEGAIKIHVRHLDNNNEPRSLTPEPLFATKVTGFAYDWTTNNLYYLSQYYSDALTLCVTNAHNPTYYAVIHDNLRIPNTTERMFFGPFLHPNKGYLYLISTDLNQIKRMNMDGSELQIVHEGTSTSSFASFAIDYEEDRLYWGDNTKELKGAYYKICIMSSNLNGGDVRQLVFSHNLFVPMSISVHRNHIYGIDAGKRIFRINKHGKRFRLLTEGGHLAYYIKIFSRKQQVVHHDHPCQNHKCEKFCYAVPDYKSGKLKAVCGCPYSWVLAQDRVSCVDDTDNTRQFVPCIYRAKCKMQMGPLLFYDYLD